MDNLRGIGLMVLSMAGFAVSDALIKLVADEMPIAQIIFVLGIGGTLIFGAMAWMRGSRLMTAAFLARPVVIRNVAEIIGTMGYVTALTLIPISTASAILQATPLLVTLGAAVFMGEAVGWRRWSAVSIGLAGVLIIIRPGMASFEIGTLIAVIGVLGLSARDLATRAVPNDIDAVVLSTYGFAMLVPTGAVLLLFGPETTPFSPTNTGILGAALITAVIAYYAITRAMRVGDVATVTPFRYSRLVFALIIGMAFFGERPDAWTLIGAAIVIGTGLYTFARERQLSR